MAEGEPSNVTVTHDAHVTDPTMLLTAQDQQLLNTQYCGITQDQTATEHTVLWHHICPNTNV